MHTTGIDFFSAVRDSVAADAVVLSIAIAALVEPRIAAEYALAVVYVDEIPRRQVARNMRWHRRKE